MADTSAIDAIAANLRKAKPTAVPADKPQPVVEETVQKPEGFNSRFLVGNTTPEDTKFLETQGKIKTNPFSASGVLDFFGKLGQLGGEVGARSVANLTKQFDPRKAPGESSEEHLARITSPAIGAIGEGASISKKAIDFLKKEANPSTIRTFLSKFGIADEEAALKAEQLAKAKSSNQVRTALGDTLEKFRTTTSNIDDIIKEMRAKPNASLQGIVDELGTKEKAPATRPASIEPPIPVPAATNAVDSAVAKLVQAIQKAAPIREDIAAAQATERGRRISQASPIFQEGAGEEGFNRALSKLKGQLTTKTGDFTAVRNELNADEIKSLFNKVQQSDILDDFEKISTQSGLRDLLEGNIPQPKQLEHLEDVFGHDIIKAIQKQTSTGKKVYNVIVDALNLPRTLITSLDLSAVLRQGLVLGVRNPKSAARAIGETFRQVFSEANFSKWLDDVKKSPDYREMKQSGLYISDPRDLAGGLTTREETFISRLAEKIPGIKASQRAYLGYLNKLRVDVFRNLSKTFKEQGAGTQKDLSSLAEFINTSTGRGSLGKFGRIAPELNTIFFSPRLIAARLSMLNPKWYANQTPAVRKEAMKTMATFIGAGTTILSLASLAGAEVETDPRSTDFGKIRVGNTRWDIWGGFQQWARVLAQLVTGQKKNTNTGEIQELTAKKYPFTTRFDVGQDFLLGKLAPVPSLALELLRGQQTFGGDLSITDQALQNILPLYLQDLKGAIDEQGLSALGTVGVPSFFGVGVQTYKPTEKKGAPIKIKLPTAVKAKTIQTHKIKI